MSANRMLRILFLVLLIPINLIAQANAADCQLPACPFKINMKDLEPLTHNNNMLSYKIQRVDKKNVKVTGILRDGSAFEILLQAGDIWSRTHRKILLNKQHHPLSDTKYWLAQALLFAKEAWQQDSYLLLKNDLTDKKFKPVKTEKSTIMRFEKYNEGNFMSIEILQSIKETVIVLQQSAC